MSPRSKREYIEAVHRRYRNASRAEKGIILDEFCAVYGCHRKHGVRLLRSFQRFHPPKQKKRGRRPVYHDPAIRTVLQRIWLTANLPCAKRLHALLPLWLPGYCKTFGELPTEILSSLASISPATIDRLLAPVRVDYQHHGRTTTKPGTLLRKQIPINTNQWDESRPGFLEADTVAHCGRSGLGTFAYTIDTVDIATGWTEQRAIWGKGETGVLHQLKDIEAMLPFPLLGFDSDNGSEFLNNHLLRHFTDRPKPVKFTRSRAYHKDDNAHVEQKNWTHVRQWLGYERFSKLELVPLLNDLYRTEWRIFHNIFCVSVKLLEKERIGTKTIKRHDAPKTPYQRIMESPHVPAQGKETLAKQVHGLNPFLLREAMERKIKAIFTLCHREE